MGIIAGMTNSFKNEILSGTHNLSSNTLKIALYLDTSDIGPSTTTYTTSGETSGTNYTAGGNTLSGVSIEEDGGTSYVDFSDSVWTSASFTTAGALIYCQQKSTAHHVGPSVSKSGLFNCIFRPASCGLITSP